MNIRVLVLAMLVLAPVAAASTGPYVGILREGQEAIHPYDNTPPGGPCPDFFGPVWWVIQLEYTPATATVSLDVPGRGSATGSNGQATVMFKGNGCEQFDVVVSALDAAVPVAYGVGVGSAPGGRA